MADLRVYPSALRGSLSAPPSKSAAHRALICAALTGRGCRVFPVSGSADMDATLRVLKAMGADFSRENAAVTFSGFSPAKGPVILDCGESGSTFRFVLPLAAALGLAATFTGSGRLPERPMGVLAEQMKAHGVAFDRDKMPFTISGKLRGGRYELPGDVSSQFVTGLLFSLPLATEDSEIVLTSPLQSAGYVDLTLDALRASGIDTEKTESGYRIRGGQSYRMTSTLRAFASAGAWNAPGGQGFRPGDKPVEGDYSNAAFWLCAAAISGEVEVLGLGPDSAQGDRAIVEIVRAFGGDVSVRGGRVSCKAAPLHGRRVDAGPIPDLIPAVAVMAAYAEGDTEIYNAARLRIKESDRLATIAGLLRGLGGGVEEYPDRLVIHGGGLAGGEADGANDHRIVMAAAIAALGCKGPVEIRGTEAVNKSYPNFFEDYQRLGGRLDGI